VRATLHDELMHEAGFETDYHRELEQRRERRRHARVWAVAHVAIIVLGVAALIQLWAGYLPGIPRPVVVTAITIIFVYHLLRPLKRYVWPSEDDL